MHRLNAKSLKYLTFVYPESGLFHLPGQAQLQCKATHKWSLPAMQRKQKQRKSELLALVKWVHSSPL